MTEERDGVMEERGNGDRYERKRERETERERQREDGVNMGMRFED